MTQTQQDEHWMTKALQLAQQAGSSGEIPIGAVIVGRSRVIAKGWNQTELLNDVTAHAEIIAITSAASYLKSKYLPDCSLYVTVEPCVMCCGAIYWSQLSRVVYGSADNKRGCSLHAPHFKHPRSTWLGGVCATQSEQLMREFFLQLRG